MDHAPLGSVGIIRNVYLDKEGSPMYTVQVNGHLVECHSHRFEVVPSPASRPPRTPVLKRQVALQLATEIRNLIPKSDEELRDIVCHAIGADAVQAPRDELIARLAAWWVEGLA